MQSAGSDIYGADRFIDDCKTAKQHMNNDLNDLTCGLYHTLGMIPGDMVAFQNSIVFHGSASLQQASDSKGRYALAVDCVKS